MTRLCNTDDLDAKTFTIKCGFKQFCKNQNLYDKINADVEELSIWIVEASIYINYIFNKMLYNSPEAIIESKPNFLDYFYHLKGKSRAKYELDDVYNQIRSKVGLEKYNGSFKFVCIRGTEI